ncbi:uncharacterized protein LOC117127779 [Brassica rapa]|uniref:uncharacterized protein LOC117127779 n=1 Tax=Brassica campestris TaxID=3711 RepID=UPI0006AA5CDD|nr:uncharacterized protein LOC117127779 [Brassica rapa]
MNPDTITRLEVDEKNQFNYMFFALGACIEGFKAMRQVIIMYGTHLKGVYKGVLLIATAQDPDHYHYPLAFAVVDETKASSRKYTRYHWRSMDIAIITCLIMSAKLAAMLTRKGLPKTFRDIAGIYSEVDFRKCYNDFRKMYPQAAEYIDDSVHETKWEPRKYALLPMLDVIVEKITEWFNKYRLLSLRVPERQILIPHVHGILHHIYPTAKKLKVTELNTFEGHYNVLGEDGHGYLVDLSNRTCYCRYFDIDRYPCVHALAAIMARGEMVEHYCSRYYWMEQWTLAYYRTIYPVPHHSTWEREYRSKRKKKFPPLIGENEESGSDSNSGGSNSSDSSGIKGNGDEGGDNEGNDE